jgi:preprotein translocase subunit YajC
VPLTSHVLAAVLAKSGGSGGGGALNFLPLVLIVLVGYFLLIRPARRRQRVAAENRTAVLPGAEVTTTAGLLATVVSVDDDVITLEIAPGVNARFVKGAIARVHSPLEPEPHMDDLPGEHEAIADPAPDPDVDPGSAKTD